MKAILSCLLICCIHTTQQASICSDIANGNPEDYSLAEINACSQTGSPRSASFLGESLTCPKLDCQNDACLFGQAKDKYGCLTCECAEDGNEGLFEADIVLTPNTKYFLKTHLENISHRRNTRAAGSSIPLWKTYRNGDNYIVPFQISSSIGSSGISAIRAAAEDFARYTCIRLERRSSQSSYINFYNGGSCSSPVGKVGGMQMVSLAEGCWQKGTVIHEVMHSLGFWHEQSRPDRDSYVKINWENISAGTAYNFNKLAKSVIDSRGSQYDIGSVMHYSSGAFSSNGRPTITDLSGKVLATQRRGLSESDIEQLNSLYGCKSTGSKTTIPVTESTTTTTSADSCIDRSAHCSYWSRNGECDKNPLYVLRNCCASCKSVTGCTDKNRYCTFWATVAKYCYSSQYGSFMRSTCSKSCKFC